MHVDRPQIVALVTLSIGILLGVGLTASVDVFADGDPSMDAVPRVIPYQGMLEINEEALTSTVVIRFNIFDGRSSNQSVYQQTHAVDVFRGRFLTQLGPLGDNGQSIASTIARSDDLYLHMTLIGAGEAGQDIALSNRQQLLSSPYAIWSTAAANFNVGNNLTVANSIMTQSLIINGSDRVLGRDDGRAQGSNTAQRAIVHGNNNTRIVNYADAFDGGTSLQGNVNVADNLNVAGNLNVIGNISANISGRVWGGCTTRTEVNGSNPRWQDSWGVCNAGTCSTGRLQRLSSASLCYRPESSSWDSACTAYVCLTP